MFSEVLRQTSGGSGFRVQDSWANVKPKVLNPEPRTLNLKLESFAATLGSQVV
jgi:hypothetical protein